MSSNKTASKTSDSSILPQQLATRPFVYYIRRDPRTFALGLVTLIATNALDVLPPILIGRGIDQLREGQELKSLAETVGLIILIISFLALFRYSWRIFWGRFSHSAVEDLRNRIFEKYTVLGAKFFNKKPVGELMSLITQDVNQFRMALGPGQLVLVDAISLMVFIPPLMWSISPSWTWKTLIFMPALPFLIRYVMKWIHKCYKIQQDRFAEMSGIAQEIVSGIRVIKGYSQEQNQLSLFNRYSKKFEEACVNTARVDALFPPVMELGIAAGACILLVIGAPEVVSGAVTLGGFFAFYQYIQRMVWPMTAIGIGITHIQQGMASFTRIRELLETPLEPANTGTKLIHDFQSLEIRNLNFSYEISDSNRSSSTFSLKNIAFNIKSGETVALFGPTGSGKTTLAELLARLYEAPPETIYINGQSIREYELESLRSQIAFVPQETFLFSDQISENLTIGCQQTPEQNEVEHIASLVDLDQEIERIPQNYEAMLGERGVNLSGGQKQRIAIARALIRKAPFLILDDSLSAVDANTEATILARLEKFRQDQSRPLTTLFISHRVSSLQWADRIIVLNEGRLEAVGRHQDLLLNSPTYARMYAIQAEQSTASANEVSL